jgi:hypothetical protein
MTLDRRIHICQIVALVAIVPVLVLGWMHMAFNAFAASGWYDPVMFAGLAVNLIAQFTALRYIRKRRA